MIQIFSHFQSTPKLFYNAIKSGSNVLILFKLSKHDYIIIQRKFQGNFYILLELNYYFTQTKFSILKIIIISQIHFTWMLLHPIKMMMMKM